ncbi:MAG: type II toxin-antitoxin system RelE/ParE family toxin [Micrococcaceae bacterium]
MSGLRLRPAAQGDLSSIWDFTEVRWGVLQAERYMSEIRVAMEHIAQDANAGRCRDEARQGYRSYSVSRHVIFYIPRDEFVDVIRVLHQRMDFSRHL